MEGKLVCPFCHQPIEAGVSQCPFCGHSLQLSPPPISVFKQLAIFTGSFFLPPMGFFWGVRFLKKPDRLSKNVGIIAIILTVFSLYLTILLTVKFVQDFNQQVSQEMHSFDDW